MKVGQIRFYLPSVLLLSLLVGCAWATPGALDTTFGTNGIYRDDLTNHTSYSLYPQDVTQQPDGLLLVVGELTAGSNTLGTTRVLLRRYTRNGPFDVHFGLDGFAAASFQQLEVYGVGKAVAVQPDYKIVVAGLTYATNNGSDTRLTIWRFTPNGYLDTTFGVDGMVMPFSPSVGSGTAVAISQGKILVAAKVRQGTVDYSIVCRLNSDGSLDSTFGSGGLVIAGSMACTGICVIGGPRALAVDAASGDIFLAGHYYDGSHHLGIARYDQNGAVVTGFGTNGVAMTPSTLTNNGNCLLTATEITKYRSVLLYPDGRVGAGGAMGDLAFQFYFSYFLGRYAAAGVADTSFANVGYKEGPCAAYNYPLYSSILQPDGKIVYLAPVNDLMSPTLFRTNVDGTTDLTWAPANNNFGSTQYLTPQGATGKMIRLGTYQSPNAKPRVMLGRYLP